MGRYSKRKPGRFWKGLFVTGMLLVLIFAGACAVLFRLDHFSLKVEPNMQAYLSIGQDEQFQEPDAEVKLVCDLLPWKGIPVDARLSVEHSVNPDQPGVYDVSFHAAWRGLDGTAVCTVVVRDTRAPLITLNEIPDFFTIPGETYVEEGYSAVDNVDGDITEKVVREETNGVVTYMVTDDAGNTATVTRAIRYYDSILPQILLTGDDTVYMEAGSEYMEPGWIAFNNRDGNLTEQVQVTGTVDKYRAGTYPLTYTVTDSDGNVTEVIRNVIVEPKGIPETIIPDGNVIYLTFDDGPCAYTLQLLKVLEHYGAKATFFVVDSEYPDILKQIVEDGHSIGIHSVKHNYRAIYSSPEAYFDDILTMQQIIYDATGVMTYLMRFPGGSSNTVSSFNRGIMSYLTQAVEDNGFRYFDWNVDSMDAGGAKEKEDVFKNVVSGVYGQRVSIVLQHDNKDFSVAAVEKILIWGLANGYRFLALDMTSPMAHHGVNN